MLSRLRTIARSLTWLLPPSRAKNALLTRLGHRIHPTARLAPNLVWHVDRFTVGAGCYIGPANMFRHITRVELAEQSMIHAFNTVSAHPIYGRLLPGGNGLVLGRGAKVMTRHRLDASALITVEAMSSLAGHASTILTHSVDLRLDAQSARPVTIGERSFVGSEVFILGGAELPDRSVLAARSTLSPSKEPKEPGMWAGAPATWRRTVDGAWFTRTDPHTRSVHIPDENRVVADAF